MFIILIITIQLSYVSCYSNQNSSSQESTVSSENTSDISSEESSTNTDISSELFSSSAVKSSVISIKAVPIKEDLINEKIDKNTFIKIIKNFNITIIESNFNQKDVLEFDKIFGYFYYAGSYTTSGDIRPELIKYFIGEGYDRFLSAVPAEIVDKFLCNKFNTKVNHSLIEEYDKLTNTYKITPFMGEYYYSVEISKYMEIEKNIFEVYSIERSLLDENSNNITKNLKFLIQIKNKDYKFLAVETW